MSHAPIKPAHMSSLEVHRQVATDLLRRTAIYYRWLRVFSAMRAAWCRMVGHKWVISNIKAQDYGYPPIGRCLCCQQYTQF